MNSAAIILILYSLLGVVGTPVGGGGGGGGGAPTDAKYIVQQGNGDLSAEQALSSLSTGVVKVTTTTGVLSTAVAGTDYLAPAAIGVTVQAYDADLTTYAGITPSANVQNYLGAADYSAMRTQLGLTIGGSVQAYDADLSTYASITPSANVQSLLGAANYSAMRTQLTLVPGTDVQAFDSDLSTWAGVTPGTGVATFLATPSSANLASAITNETGSGVLVFATSPTLVTPALGAATATSLSVAGDISTTAGANRLFTVNRSSSTDYCRFMFQNNGTEQWALGMRGDSGGAATHTLTLTGLTSDGTPNIVNFVPGSPYTVAVNGQMSLTTPLNVASGGTGTSANPKKVFSILVGTPDGDALTTGDGKAAFRVPAEFNGMNLVAVESACTTVSSSGIPTIQLRRSRRTNATTRSDADMLTTKETIDAGEFDSADAAAADSINTSNDDLVTGDMVLVDVDVAGTGVKGLVITCTLQLP